MNTRLLAAGLAAAALVALAPAATAQPKLCNGLLPGRPHAAVSACVIGHGDATVPAPKKKKDCDHHGHGG